jgi:SP family galactose:H+ symporter-like MFS transporter
MADEISNQQESKFLLDTDNNNDSSNAASKFLYLSCLIVAFGFFTLGYDIGSISGSMIFITDYFSLTFLWHELLVSLAVGPAIVGALFSGYSNEIIGRKFTLLLSAVIFIIGSLVMACAFSATMLLFGRILTGIAFGKFC